MTAVKRKQENSATKGNRKKPKVESRSATAVKKAAAAAAAAQPPPPRITEVESDDELNEHEPSLDGSGDDGGDGDEDGSEDEMAVKDTATTTVPTAKTAEERMFQFLVPLPCRDAENK